MVGHDGSKFLAGDASGMHAQHYVAEHGQKVPVRG
jgi:hypothetical protein